MSEININEVVGEFRKTLDTLGDDSAAGKEKLAKIEADLDKFEEKSAQMTAELLESKKREEDLKERYDGLEAKLLRLPAGKDGYREASEEMKAFEGFLRKGDAKLTADEVKYLRTDVDTDGGYLAPPEMSTELIRQITELSPIRQLARVQRTSRGSVEIPKRTSIPTAYRVPQGGTDTQTNSNYGLQVLSLNRMTVDVPVTLEMLSDSAFNIEQEINTDAAEAFAVLEGNEFVNGTGTGEFEGILVNADVAATTSGVANDITADSLYTVQGTLKTGYMGTFVFNRTTRARIRRLKDGTGAYLWQPMAAGVPNTVAGDPYVITPDMPDIAASAYPIAYGDFSRGYRMADHTDTTLLRDPYSQGRAGKVLIIMHRRNAGKVVLAEAIKKLQCAV